VVAACVGAVVVLAAEAVYAYVDSLRMRARVDALHQRREEMDRQFFDEVFRKGQDSAKADRPEI
jgi:hypothetical protein